MPNTYETFALSYRAWHCRMTTERLDHRGPAAGFAAMHGLNALSLMLLLPIRPLPYGLFIGIPFAIGFFAFWLVNRIYRVHATPPLYANSLSENVPAFREFPLVYAYLLGTFLLFFGCVYLATRGAA